MLPADQPAWDRIRRAAHEIADAYGFLRIDVPILEHIELFERSVGAPTDIVEKQMFIVSGKGKDRLALRPEATAGIARAFIEHGLGQLGSPLKLFTEGPMFRHEQPQAGRTRQFHQFNLEIISVDDDPIYDAQAILTAYRFLECLKLRGLSIALNSIGCKNCRPAYRKELTDYYKPLRAQLCADCQRRLEVNPLRLLDCKVEQCRKLREDAPIIIDHLCSHCHSHFKLVLEYLEEVKLPYALDHHLVRGLDYYSKTVFEIVGEGADFSLAGGGRYDYLIELLGGKSSPAVGWAASAERIIEMCNRQGIVSGTKPRPRPFLIYIGDLAKKRSLGLVEQLRRAGVDVAESFGKESLKGQLHAADKLGSPLALIFGQREAFEESIIVRDLKSGVQETVPLPKVAEVIKKKLKER